MKIAHIVWCLDTGGVESMLVNIINEQVKHENVELYIINDRIFPPLLNKISKLCKIHQCKRVEGSKQIFPIIKLNIDIFKQKPDIIHVHYADLSRLILGNYKIVRTIHNTHNPCNEYPKMDALYAISNSVKEYTANQGFYNVTVVENGIDADSFKKKEGFKPRDSIYHLVQISRLYKVSKGQHILIAALAKLVNERNINNFHMHFIGDGPSKDEYIQMIKELGLKEYFTFEGIKTQDYIKEHLCEFDLGIQPSTHEGFGLTVAEIIAAKVPVLVSNIEGPMEIIDYGKFGMYFKSKDIDDLADKLEIVLQGKYDYSKVDQAYQHVSTNYSVQNTANKYIVEYKKVINR